MKARAVSRATIAAWIITATLAATAFAGISPLRALGGGAAVPAGLRLSPFYIALAPWTDVLDNLSLMSASQHGAFLLTLAGAYLAWRLGKARSSSPLPLESAKALAFFGVVLAVYAAGLLLPRPMASLELLRNDALAVDFHSHTNASWDGRRDFSPERNRSWHQSAGFNAVYISDHATLAGVIDASMRNPHFAGEGTAVLPAVEIRCEGQHIVILGATIHEGIADCAAPATTVSSIAEPSRRWESEGMITLLTIPGRLSRNSPLPLSQGIEIADGAPRALDQMRKDSSLIRDIARTGDMALVSGSNNHGWGSTAAAWSVLIIPGWRSLTPAALDAAIRARMGSMRAGSVFVLERRRVVPGSSLIELSLTLPAVAWNMFRTMSVAERVSWLVWTWFLFLAVPRVAAKRKSLLDYLRAGVRLAPVAAPRSTT
jgi:hypothetical protein